MTESSIVQIVRVTPTLRPSLIQCRNPATGDWNSLLMDDQTKLIVGLMTVSKFISGPYSPIGGEGALDEIVSSGLSVGSHYFGYPCSRVGGHLWQLLPYRYTPTMRKTCILCGSRFIGRQWHAHDLGYGLGDCCVESCRNQTDPAYFEEIYGIEGYTYRVQSSRIGSGVYHDRYCVG